MPKISIIVPVYNMERYLRRCLDSIVAQSMKDIEIIVLTMVPLIPQVKLLISMRQRMGV